MLIFELVDWPTTALLTLVSAVQIDDIVPTR